MKKLVSTALLSAFALTSSVTASNCNTEKSKNIVQTAVAAGSFKTLTAALGAADLTDTLKGKGSFTVFAPTDQAFAKLPKSTLADLLKPENKTKLQAILKFHVVSGRVGLSDALKAKQAKSLQGEPININFDNGKVKINDASLVTADIKSSNGVIHVIDSVMLPPISKNNIANVAKKAGKFNTLLAAINAAGLTNVISGSQPLTVFAPTDAAFRALPAGTVESLLKPENIGKLKEILTLHVVKGNVSAGTALNSKSAQSLGGGTLSFKIKNGKFKVNDATIVEANISCENGTIHVIDTILMPDTRVGNNSHSSNRDPRKMITTAINKGVRTFNHGNHSKCADIYKECLVSLSRSNQLDCSMRANLTRLIENSEKIDCVTTRAWAFRAGLDCTLAAMKMH